MTKINMTHDCPEFLKFLERAVAGPEDIRALQEFYGYCFRRWNMFPKFLFLLGAGGDGQDVAAMVLRLVLGLSNCSWYSVPEMMEPGVLTAIRDKYVNISYGGNARDMTSPFFRSLLLGSPAWGMDGQGNHFAFIPACKFVFVSGHLPRDLRQAGAFLDNALVVRFRNCLTALDRDPAFVMSMEQERLGIGEWALRGLVRLLRNGRFTDPAWEYVYGNTVQARARAGFGLAGAA